MKKNLRIVSAAAAALLAVAPVAATVVPSANAATPSANAVYSNTKQSDLQTAAKNSVLNQMSAWVSENNTSDKLGVNGGSLIQLANGEHDVINPTVKAGTVTATAGNPSVTTTNGKVTDASVPVTWSTDLTVTVKTSDLNRAVNKGQTSANSGEYQIVLGQNWDNASLTTKKVTTDGDNTVLTFTFSKTVNVKFNNVENATADKALTAITPNNNTIFTADANTSVNINAVAANGNIPGALNGNISVTLDGKNFDALLHFNGDTNVKIYNPATKQYVSSSALKSKTLYEADFDNVSVNLGADYTGKEETFTLAKGVFAKNGKSSLKVKVNANGVANLGKIVVPFYAYDASVLRGIHFYSVKTGEVVTSGKLDLHAVNGKLSLQSVYNAMNIEYGASQYIDGKVSTLNTVNDLRDQLKKQNITVDANGYFTAPSSFTVNMNAKSNVNGAEASLPVTINVDNATATTTNETTKDVTVMHIAAIYNKEGKQTNASKLRAYNSVKVVSEPVTINGAKFYKLADKAADGSAQYIKVSNIDGTSKTLKKNSYIYKRRATGSFYATKASKKNSIKAGTSKTVYGGKLYGNWYRVGKNEYIRSRNF